MVSYNVFIFKRLWSWKKVGVNPESELVLDVFEASLLIMNYVLGLLLIGNPFPASSFTEVQMGHLLSTFMMSSKDSFAFVVYLIPYTLCCCCSVVFWTCWYIYVHNVIACVVRLSTVVFCRNQQVCWADGSHQIDLSGVHVGAAAVISNSDCLLASLKCWMLSSLTDLCPPLCDCDQHCAGGGYCDTISTSVPTLHPLWFICHP